MKSLPGVTTVIRRKVLSFPPSDACATQWHDRLDAKYGQSSTGFSEWLHEWVVEMGGGGANQDGTPFTLLRPLVGGGVSDDQLPGADPLLLTPHEWRIANEFVDPITRALEQRGPRNFVNTIETIAHRASDGTARFRKAAASTVPDGRGVVIEYPSPNDAMQQLHRVHEFLRDPNSGTKARRAVVTLVAFQNAHPLVDGNGRVGRILFNTIMAGNGMRYYLPIREINGLSRGGVLSRIRGAEVAAGWEELSMVLGSAISILYRLYENRRT